MGLLPKSEYFSRALYTFDIGQNDLAAGYFHNLTVDQVKGSVPDILNQFKSVVKVIDYSGHYYTYILYIQSIYLYVYGDDVVLCRVYMGIKEVDHSGYITLVQLVVTLTSWTDFPSLLHKLTK